MTAGRQFVEGVSGSRPGTRRPAPRGEGRAPLRPRLDDLGRWVEDRLDWLLEDGDDWREPWQEEGRSGPSPSPAPRSRRQGLEAVSRRGREGAATTSQPPFLQPPSLQPPSFQPPAPLAPPAAAAGGVEDSEWPDDASFSLPRWQRPDRPERREATGPRESDPPVVPGSRPLPRSSRRRP